VLISFVAILCDFLPILLANIPSSMTVTKESQNVCNGITITILILMLICLLVLILRDGTAVRHLPREPNTLASVMLYVASSEQRSDESMLRSFRYLAIENETERDEKIRRKNVKYKLGLLANGILCIDEESRISRSLI
jgi:hypothetical protein